MESDRLFSAEEVAKRWNITTQTLVNWRSKGIGPAYIKFAGKICYKGEAVYEYETSKEIKPKG